MSDPLISVIVTVYNTAPFLRQCLNSLKQQTFRDWEAICIDDGSEDESWEILQQYTQQDNRFHIFSQPNSGAASARNRGLELARGSFIQIVDGDDFFDFHMLENLYKKARQTDADIVLAVSWTYNTRSGQCFYNDFCQDRRFLPSKNVFNRQDLPLRLFQCCVAWAWDKFYKASFLKQHGFRFQDLKANNDMVFAFLSIACAERIAVAREAHMYWRRNNPKSITASQANTPLCFYEAMSELKKQLIARHLYTELEHTYCTYVLQWSLEHFQKIASPALYNALHRYIYKELGAAAHPLEYYTYEPLHGLLMWGILHYSYKSIRPFFELKYLFYRLLSLVCLGKSRELYHHKARLFKRADQWLSQAHLPGLFSY